MSGIYFGRKMKNRKLNLFEAISYVWGEAHGNKKHDETHMWFTIFLFRAQLVLF